MALFDPGLDILKEKWSAVYNVQTILLSIQALLGEPNNDSPLNGQAAQLWDQKEGNDYTYQKNSKLKWMSDTPLQNE